MPVTAAGGSGGSRLARVRERLQKIAFARRIVIVTVALLALVHVGNVALVIHYFHMVDARAGEARVARANLLAEHAARTLGAIDLSLQTIADALKRQPNMGKPTVFTQMLLDRQAKQLPQIQTLATVDQNGITLNISGKFPAAAIDVSDRPHFAEQKKWRGVGFYIGPLSVSRRDDREFFPISRPILDNDGNFLGIVAALIDPTYFSGFYGPTGQAAGETALLERTDGTALAGLNSYGREIGSTNTNGDQILAHPNKRNRAVAEVPGYPLRVVVAGMPTWTTPQFTTFVATDVALIATMTLIALFLAAAAAREASVVARAIAARETAETRLLDAIESAPAGFALFDRDDRLVLSNSLFRSFFSQVGHEIAPGNPFEDIFRAGVANRVYADTDTDTDEAEYVSRRMERHPKAGEELLQKLEDGRWLMTRERRTNEGGIVCFYSDITPLKEKEEALVIARERAEQADRTKSAFLANMSHELRTPLNAIIGFSEMIERALVGPISAKYRQYGEIIHGSGQHLLAIIGDILDIAKLQAGKTELNLEAMDIAHAIDEAIQIVSKRAADGKIAIRADIAVGLPRVEADPIRLRQILLNLLSNAVKFTPENGKVSVTACAVAGSVDIAVTDTGIGMAPEQILLAMEPFTQITNRLNQHREGTGLGLPITKKLVELHGGSIDLASALNQGTTVTIHLPLSVAGRHAPRERLASGTG